jgi:hypothetical protein
MGVAAIRDGLATRLATIAGLKVYHEVPESIGATPAVLVKPESGAYYTAMGQGVMHIFSLTILVSLSQGHPRAQADLDTYLAFTGAESIRAAIEADGTLGGACDTLKVSRYYDYGGHEYAGTTYLGVRIECEIYE